jgi:hypothetical protein
VVVVEALVVALVLVLEEAPQVAAVLVEIAKLQEAQHLPILVEAEVVVALAEKQVVMVEVVL